MNSNYFRHLEYEYQEQLALERKLGRISSENEAAFLRASVRRQQFENQFQQALAAEVFAGERYRNDHSAHMKVLQYVGELEDELFKTGEDFEDRFH